MVTAANVHDSVVFKELVDAIEPIEYPRGRPRKRPEKLHTDKAYDTIKSANGRSGSAALRAVQPGRG